MADFVRRLGRARAAAGFLVFALVIALLAIPPVHADDGEFAAVSPPATATHLAAAAPTDRPESHPYLSTGAAAVDDYALHPLQRRLRSVRASYRGALHAVRDLLFPQYRSPAAASKESQGLLDVGFEDESWEDVRARHASRDWWLGLADAYELPRLYQEHPDSVRYGVAIVLGTALLGVVMLVRYGSLVCARVCLKGLVKATGDESWTAGLDAPEEPERYIHNAAQAARYAADDRARAAAAAAAAKGGAANGTSGSSRRGARRRQT
jgi:hypothetical protein